MIWQLSIYNLMLYNLFKFYNYFWQFHRNNTANIKCVCHRNNCEKFDHDVYEGCVFMLTA